MARPNDRQENRDRELPEELIEGLARILAEVLVLEYRAKTKKGDDEPVTVKSPTGTHRDASVA